MNSSSSHAAPLLDAVIHARATLLAEQRRAIGAGMVGYILEWFDFECTVFSRRSSRRIFFRRQTNSPRCWPLFGVFGVGFVARPIGSVVLGRIADVRAATSRSRPP